MIELHEGLSLSGRCTCGLMVGWITEIKRETYRIRWLDKTETEQLRPDFDDEEEAA